MCGIVGYVGEQQSAPILVSGLKKLEYRGYDSAGRGGGGRQAAERGPRQRQAARTSRRGWLAEPPQGTTGIGHTRWATHGRPSDENAHPHTLRRAWRWSTTASSRTTWR